MASQAVCPNENQTQSHADPEELPHAAAEKVVLPFGSPDGEKFFEFRTKGSANAFKIHSTFLTKRLFAERKNSYSTL